MSYYTKILLEESEQPTQWYNTKALIEQEMNTERYIDIPEEALLQLAKVGEVPDLLVGCK